MPQANPVAFGHLLTPVVPPILTTGMPGSDDRARCSAPASSGSYCGTRCRALSFISSLSIRRTLAFVLSLRLFLVLLLLLGLRLCWCLCLR